MRYRQLSPTGDYTFGSNLNNFYIDVPAAVGQAVKTRLELWSGEWYLDITDGTQYIQGVLGKHSQSMADTTIQNRVLATQNLTDISSFESTLNTVPRSYSVQMKIDTDFGPTAVQISNYVNY